MSGLRRRSHSGGSAAASTWRAPALLPAEKPRLSASGSTVTHPPKPWAATKAASRSAEPSPEALSTTTTRVPGMAATCAWSERRQSSTRPAVR